MQLTNNKRVTKDLLVKQQPFQTIVSRSQMLDPD
jgi:hypothetical protein